MYINSPGISTPDGRAMGFDTEAFAIADVMSYIRAPVATVCVGQCYGSAAMLLACGEKGQRYSLPNGRLVYLCVCVCLSESQKKAPTNVCHAQ